MGMWDRVACGIGLGSVAQLEFVSADFHSSAPIPKEGLCRHHSPCQGGWNKE